MLFLRSKTHINIFLRYIRSFSSNNTTIPIDDDYLIFKTGLSPIQQSGVLEVLNNANTDQLYRYGISKNRVKSIESWRIRKGPFKSLNDVLEVDGLGEKILETICKRIIENNVAVADTQKPTRLKNASKYLRELTTPPLQEKVRNSIKSVSGIHITPIGVSWARITTTDNELTDWSYENLTTLPSKMSPVETFDLGISLVQKIIPSDVYVLENHKSMQQKATVSFNQQMELSSILLALLNTSIKHNMSLQEITTERGKKIMNNKVFFLKKRIAARLFGLVIGLETISSVAIVQNFLTGTPQGVNSIITPVSFNAQLKETFENQSPANKELLGQALLLTMTFCDLCIYKNNASINALFNTNQRNKSNLKK